MRFPLRGLFPLLLALLIGAASATKPVRTLVLGAEDDAAPWSMADGSGYVNALVQAIYAQQGWTLKLEILPYARCKTLVLRGELAGCFTASKDAELGRALLFPRQPVIAPRHQLYVKQQSELHGCQPSQWGRALTVAQTHGYEYADAITKMLAGQQLLPQVVVTESAGLRMLAVGRVDAALLTTDEVKPIDYVALLAGDTTRLRLLCDYGSHPGYLVFSPKHPQGRAALAAFERGFDHLEHDGSIARLQQAWAGRVLTSANKARPR